ncbi:two component transcriptional regulator, LuxR family [Pseudogulbenkiania sp. NH8B]|uniref:Two component transcriptional regulator, LuxR family n=1 Tax=Pseudogulbenkiania ferrooxidans 2002 TaxID=279714 RepID=B9YZJ3_9NEIS|nr:MULTISPECIES: response regulator transcription factor [Pseudogulbenkiania]EEG10546.1 two component transcriptional regulator, LuxR family [Pseudogulbenkiania ferrooxidans 2002]BAK78196.1 two component transcriptional regulator, LuxR family [Pseudogulbenkiania sp. NH8B]
MEATVLIADDHPLFREAMRLVVSSALGEGSEIVECESLDAALDAVRRNPAIELAMIDINMPGMDGLAGLARLRQQAPTLPVIVVSADERHSTVEAAMSVGASGFIPKSFSRDSMTEAVNAVLGGDIYLPPSLADRDTGVPGSSPEQLQDLASRLALLTKQERCVLDYIVGGKSNKVVAIELNIAESTVKAHVSAILRKLKVSSRTQAVIKVGALLRM